MDVEKESYILSDFKVEDENTHHAGGKGATIDEEDEEDGGGYHKSYQCANQ
jgi:hypothetical protein